MSPIERKSTVGVGEDTFRNAGDVLGIKNELNTFHIDQDV